MPAILDDPARPAIYRTSGAPPYLGPGDTVPPIIHPRQVTLRDRVTIATLVPFSSPAQVPPSLLAYICEQLNREIEKGDTYPMVDPLPLSTFGPYWFGNFAAVMLLGEIERAEDVREGKDWTKECLGSFYVKPNYPGRSSHVCNGGFLVTDAARNRGVGRLMGEGYLEWAPMLGYTYSVFNLVYESNVASCRIWDALGFKRIGRVKGCGNLKSYPDQLIDAIIYGRDLGPEGEDYVSEERFDKIKFYLKHGKYPNGADRAEKSRLRSAATHYKLLDDDRLMLKDKEVIPDAQKQYEIARAVHLQQHGGINKTTATIAEKFHWVRIKETVSLVIRNCTECKELAKAPVVRADLSAPAGPRGAQKGLSNDGGGGGGGGGGILGSSNGGASVSAAGRILSLPSSTNHPVSPSSSSLLSQNPHPPPPPPPPPALPSTTPHNISSYQHPLFHHHHHHHHQVPIPNMHPLQDDYPDLPLDPQIMMLGYADGVLHLSGPPHNTPGAGPTSSSSPPSSTAIIGPHAATAAAGVTTDHNARPPPPPHPPHGSVLQGNVHVDHDVDDDDHVVVVQGVGVADFGYGN